MNRKVKINPKIFDYSIAPTMTHFNGIYYLVPAFIKVPDDNREEFYKAHYDAFFDKLEKDYEDMHRKEWKVKSSSTDKYYIVRFEDSLNDYTCTCPAYKYRGRCRHITEISNKFKT